ncbi:SET and MYND domain-containing protein 4-like [Aphidius gifuensis]|uniref:SET and MYND domain-containing protein 4-like n=1 Tax=Aphidius gifuensis TaxID=684658 RepID=UPI001CDCBFF3|nr:SET and MYND domain-containing protein 4-like [Aphidius gifuensis]XP_044004259.1 SET and MYND domain-containing protein 4-like [Aphidius gifuensis]
MDFIEPPLDEKDTAEEQFSAQITLKNKFAVIWKFISPFIIESRDELNKTVGDSMHWRKIGNKEYTTSTSQDYLRKSIEAYTKSIAFAPLGSNELSLAYANRSAVLFKARLYEDCLLDIERSLKSGYPGELKTALFLRQSLCFKALKSNSDLEASISMVHAIRWLPDLKNYNPAYDITKEYPKMINEIKEPREIIKFIPEIQTDNAIIVGASDAIELKKTNDNNQHIVATRDIKSGEFIYICEPLAATPSNELRFTSCWHCCRQTWAGVPCNDCPNIIYCSDICKRKAWDSYHNLECVVLKQFVKSEKMDTQQFLTVKLFCQALNSAGGLLELKKQIDNIDSMNNEEFISTNGIFDGNTIDNFHRLDYSMPTLKGDNFESLALFPAWIVSILCQKTYIVGKKMTVNELINEENKNIFILGEILLRYMMIVHHNGLPLIVTEPDSTLVWSNVMVPLCKTFKRNLDPNVDWTHADSKVGFYTCKPIKQGEEILISTSGPCFITSQTARHVASIYGRVACKCVGCDKKLMIVEYLPSYHDVPIGTRITREFDCMMLKLKEWEFVIEHGDTEDLLTIKNALNNINDKIHQNISGPCYEIACTILALKSLNYRLLTVLDPRQ